MGKVKFNLKNVHYARLEEDGTYGTIKTLPGAVSLSIDATGDEYRFFADGIPYYEDFNNTGYEGDLEIAEITDDFRQEILGETMDANKVLTENANAILKQFALGFEIGGNVKPTLFWFLRCTASRPSTEANTSEASKSVDTDTLNWTAAPNENGDTRHKTSVDTPDSVRNTWFNQVYTKSAANG